MTADPVVATGRAVGLFGGSFDPVHDAHLALGQAALRQLRLDELRWLPTGNAWHKQRALTPAVHRIAMLALALADEPRYVIDRREVDRSGPSYTLDTVNELQREQPDARWFLLIGQDQFAGFHTWRGWRELGARVTLAVAERPGMTRSVEPDVLALSHRRIEFPPIDESSTGVRERIAAGLSINDLVPPAVARYIEQHHLYRGSLGS